jgi:hypothetical protein
MARCYEDFAVGEVVEAGAVVVTADATKHSHSSSIRSRPTTPRLMFLPGKNSQI